MAEEKKHIIYTAEDIKRYITGEMLPAEMHAIEMAALDDPLLAEAMEGYELMEEKDWSKELAALKQQFNKNKNSPVIPISKAPAFKWWKAAAAVVVLGITATTAYIVTNKNETQASQETAKVETINTATDSSRELAKADSAATFLNTTPAADSNSQLIAKLDKKTITVNSAAGSTVTVMPGTMYSVTTEDNAATRSDSVTQSPAGSDYYAMNEKRAVADDAARKKEYKAEVEESAAAPGKISANGNSDIVVNERDFKNKAEAESIMGYDKKDRYNAATTFKGVVVTPDNKPLSYAGIKMPQAKKPVYADAQGAFHITAPDTSLKVTVSSAGFMPQEFTLQSLAAQNKIILQPQDVATQKIGAYRSKTAAKKPQQSFADSTDLDDEEAVPAGGWAEYNNYLSNNIKLTEGAKQKNVHGEVEVTVKFKDNGDISTVKVAKPLSPELDAEAMRLVKEGPKWDTKGNKKTKVKVKVKF